MKITKYPQSHLVIEQDGKKLVIDPGSLTFENGFTTDQFKGADAYFITHIHEDHLGSATIKEIVGNSPVFGNENVIQKLKEIGVEGTAVSDRQKFEVAGIQIEAVDLPHFPYIKDIQMPPNTGFIINGIFFHPGDGYEVSEVSVNNAAIPYGHPFVSTNSALKFAESLNAKLIIPIHYDAYPRDPEELVKFGQELGIEVRVLEFGNSTEI